MTLRPSFLGTSSKSKRTSYRSIAKAETNILSSYDRLLALAKMSGHDDFFWCCNPKCNSGQIHEKSSGNVMRCHVCRFPQCTGHQNRTVEWHYGELCQQYEIRTNSVARRLDENKRSDSTIIRTTKPCPDCGVRIEKNEGCDHIKCKFEVYLFVE
jgi:IBR (half RING finger) domain-containing protein